MQEQLSRATQDAVAEPALFVALSEAKGLSEESIYIANRKILRRLATQNDSAIVSSAPYTDVRGNNNAASI